MILFLVLGLAAVIALVWIIYRSYSNSPAQKQTACISNLKQLGTALAMYVSDNDDRLPLDATWQVGLSGYLGGTASFDCPAAGSQPSYTYNNRLDGLRIADAKDPSYCAALFDATLTDPHAVRHPVGDNCLFVDGHTTTVPKGSAGQYSLDPVAQRSGGGSVMPSQGP